MIELPSESDFVSSLDALAWAGERWVWKSRLREGMRAHAPKGMVFLLVMPVLAIVLTALGWVTGQPWKLPVAVAVLLSPVPTALYLGWHLIQFWRKQPSRGEGLAVFDEKLSLKDRLQTADEFLGVENRTPFMEAAIADAWPAIERASQQPLDWDRGRPWIEYRRWSVVPMAAIVLLVIGALLPVFSHTKAAAEKPDLQPVELAGRLPGHPEDEPRTPFKETKKTPEPKAERLEEHRRKAAKGEPAPSKISENPSSRLAGREKISLGTSEGGQTSQATSSGRASQSRGMPSSQAPSSLPENRPEVEKRNEKQPEKEKTSETRCSKVVDQSGATAGRGSSGGSSRNPASTDWSSKDRTEAADNEAFEQEEDVDDEQSESEARGGLQPNLRDRRPPVNRDLSIGFGSLASPDANGRGGPGERKKSRGVASLVLGVPVPDHVKGQPNPGRVKINQERVQPQGEEVPQGTAEDRGRRSCSAGHLSERTLDASMRHIVRDYFLKTQVSDAQSTLTETSDD